MGRPGINPSLLELGWAWGIVPSLWKRLNQNFREGENHFGIILGASLLPDCF